MPLLTPDPTQPAARTISGVPLYVSPAVAADLVWAIPAAHSLFVLRQDSSVVTDSSVFFTQRLCGSAGYAASGVRVHVSACCREDHEGVAMPEREVKQTLVSYLDEEGIRRYGLAGETVNVHTDHVERFDKLNGGPPAAEAQKKRARPKT